MPQNSVYDKKTTKRRRLISTKQLTIQRRPMPISWLFVGFPENRFYNDAQNLGLASLWSSSATRMLVIIASQLKDQLSTAAVWQLYAKAGQMRGLFISTKYNVFKRSEWAAFSVNIGQDQVRLCVMHRPHLDRRNGWMMWVRFVLNDRLIRAN